MYQFAFQIEKNHETMKKLGMAMKEVSARVVTLKELDNSYIYGLKPVDNEEKVSLSDYHKVLDRLIGNV